MTRLFTAVFSPPDFPQTTFLRTTSLLTDRLFIARHFTARSFADDVSQTNCSPLDTFECFMNTASLHWRHFVAVV
ncbi:MAG: hypothetical protein GY820_47710 [Gammaproteobacteria bacterium]|nr:hypothetical protein [Gammaproteobacteria bacterium]